LNGHTLPVAITGLSDRRRSGSQVFYYLIRLQIFVRQLLRLIQRCVNIGSASDDILQRLGQMLTPQKTDLPR